MNIQRANTSTLDYLIMFLFISISGNPVLTADTTLLTVVFVFVSVLFYDRRKMFYKGSILFFTILLIIYLFQTLIFSFFSFSNILGMFIKILTGYMVVVILGPRFIDYFIKVMFALALMSLAFYMISNLNIELLRPFLVTVSGEDAFISKYSVFGLHTLMSVDTFRNHGYFWEAGAFGGYLLIAFIFNFYLNGSAQKRRSIVLLLTIITTVSTTAYLGLFIFLFIAYYKKIKNVLLRAITVLVILAGGYFAFYNLDFIGEKIKAQLADATNVHVQKSSTNTQRFLSIYRDIDDFKGHEFFGRGTHSTTRYSYGPADQIRTVGLTDILVKFGFPFFLLILYLMYRSICKYLESYGQNDIIRCVSIFVTILVSLMSEPYFNYPMYWSLLFLLFVYKPSEKVYESSKEEIK